MSEENYNGERGEEKGDAKKIDEKAKASEREWESFRESMDQLFAKIIEINAPLIVKKNVDDKYEQATFKEAMDFLVTSNALSLIRGVYQNCLLSSTTAISARDVIEGLVLLEMSEKGAITEEDERLFLCQYALIEYDTYYKDGQKFKDILNLSDLTERYERAKKIYNEAGVDGGVERGKVRRAAQSRAPFLFKHFQKGTRADFNALLGEYLPTMLTHYDVLSYYVHPNANTATKGRADYFAAIRAVVDAVAQRYENYAAGVRSGGAVGSIMGILKGLNLQPMTLTQRLESLCNPADKGNAATVQLIEWKNKQEKILLLLAKDFEEVYKVTLGRLPESKLIRAEDNFITRFFQTTTEVLYDVTFDYILKLSESVKIKFKVLAERFAHFDRVIEETINSRASLYGVTMLKYHELVKAVRRRGGKVPDDVTPTLKEIICNNYKSNYPQELYPQSSVYYRAKNGKNKSKQKWNEQIMASFCQPLGNFLDGRGSVPKYVDLVVEYFAKYYSVNSVLDVSDAAGGIPTVTGILASDYMDMLYRESNNMSHGCGYLYFANRGALGDDGPVMQAFDNMIVLAVTKLIKEIEEWQRQCGEEASESINRITASLLKNLNAAAESLAVISVKKTLLYRARPKA